MAAFDWSQYQSGPGMPFATPRPPSGPPEDDAEAKRRAALAQNGVDARNFANQGEAGYGAMTAAATAARDYLKRLASGQESVSAEQLRQGTQQNMSAQRSMAAGAAPQNAAMAARTAAIQSARLSSGMAGQQALAGIQERQAAQQALANMILQQRGQDIQVGLGSRQNAINANSQGTVGAPPPTFADKALGVLSGAIPLAFGMPRTPQQPQQPASPPSGLVHENPYAASTPPSPNPYDNLGGKNWY